MKQIKQTTAEKLGFKTETLRKLSQSMTPEQLQEAVGGRDASGGARSATQTNCSV
ncbi:MAG: hypothetical protein K8W52_25630 [Deltaproteobacteria bacterium]|nr:hypothetical protein [Deltaproteobacteria bacterium]